MCSINYQKEGTKIVLSTARYWYEHRPFYDRGSDYLPTYYIVDCFSSAIHYFGADGMR
ncbi:hypothetical protein SAMN04487967_1650 [Natronorubrum sediminis]|uniref:Uncharacterized protein n=1 Tax=Natronorubrum sediminis TaxID=640943 RepID=A0A1H6FUS1_9EURY|nr:hypothetical protein SAMN04487967_1650 [Natronorubrum sediminis]